MPETSLASEHPRFADPGFAGAVLAAVPEGLLVLEDERVVEVNGALCALTGFPREELVGTPPPLPFVPRDQLDRVGAFLKELRETGSSEVEVALVRKDGSGLFAHLAGATVRAGERTTGRVVTVRDITASHRRQERLEELAATDELTGILNKRSFLVNLAGEVARARRHLRPLSLAILDLDGFKRINDEAGHQAGDRVLAEAAGRLGALVRAGEHLARLGGDEFGWILPDAEAEGATAAVSRAQRAIASESFRGMGSLTVSAGICVTDGSVDASEVYRRADRALYRAKGEGRDRAVIY